MGMNMFLQNRSRRARPSRKMAFSHRWRILRGEHLESRRMFAADLQAIDLRADGQRWIAEYAVENEAAEPFDVSVYASSDGVTLDRLLQTSRVTASELLTVGGTHQIVIAPDFTDDGSDYALLMVLDSTNEVTETSETNNRAAMAGGIFLTTDGALHVHGGNQADSISITHSQALNVELGTWSTSFAPSSVTSIHIRTHDGQDSVVVDGTIALPVIAWGGAGNDTLIGGGGHDVLRGGLGNDVISGGGGNDWLYGDNAQVWGNDVASGGDDVLWGDEGDDWLFGEGGADTVYGGDGIDTGYGGYGDDDLYTGNNTNAASEYLFGNQGNDSLHLENAHAIAYDYEGQNNVHFYDGGYGYGGNSSSGYGGNSSSGYGGSSNTGYGGYSSSGYGGNSSAGYSGYSDSGYGGNSDAGYGGSSGSGNGLVGDLHWSLANEKLSISGSASNDTMVLTTEYYDGQYWLSLGGQRIARSSNVGNIVVSGGDGDDLIDLSGISPVAFNALTTDVSGGAGSDMLAGSSTADILDGGEGNDWLMGNAGDDMLIGQSGDDRLEGGDGSDYLYGGYGDDTLYAESYGGYGDYGGTASDYLYGGADDDSLHGGSGNDLLDGGTGQDTIVGSAGDVTSDRPRIVDCSIAVLGNSIIKLTGRIVDDEDPTGRIVASSGIVIGAYTVTEDDMFAIEVNLASNSGWITLTFTDAEGLMAEEYMAYLS